MKSLYFKEVAGFFNSITGYIVVVVFLVANGLFLWVFPGAMNVFDAGYASLDTLFFIAPWVFLFLIPAITMRSFSEEKKSGNLDLLLTRPLSEFQIILAKYFAGVTVAVIALVPTFVFYISLVLLGDPTGNIDTGGTLGSYLGLFLLSSIYVSAGIFASSLTENTIVAFVLSVLLCFFLYQGFNSFGYLSLTGKTGNFIINLGIDAHFKSMQRGVIDTRDVVYFLSVIVLFLFFTRTKIRSRNW
jgi:ABC-2 type transport system permease protein